MTLELIIASIGTLATITGLLLIWYQVKSARNDSITGSLISAVDDHWKIIEERKMRLRTGEESVYYPSLFPTLDELLAGKYDGDLMGLAKDYLFDHWQRSQGDKQEIFEAIAREYAYQDLTFNLYEEEFIAGRYLKLVDSKIWDYWEFYIRDHFTTSVKQNHWRLRRRIGRTFPPFVEFVESRYIPSA